jgi:hypothetical protein
MSMKRIVGAIAIALLAAACARTPKPSGVTHPTGADELVLRVQNGGGLINPAVTANQVPEFSLFGDGSAISPGAVPAIYPGPAIEEPIVTPLTDNGVHAILAAAKQAGLFANNTSNGPGIPDTGTTLITVNVDGHTYVSRYVGLGPSGADASVSRFVGRLSNLRSWLPAGSVGADHPYSPTSLALTVHPYEQGSGPGQTPIAWPLATPLSGFGTTSPGTFQGGSCGVVTASDLAKLMPLISKANQLTPWTDSGKSYGIVFRPLLPDQTGC